MTDLAVMIVNWNTCDLLRTCLTSLYQHAEGLSYEIFVVDNASTDGSPAMVAQEFPAVRLLCNAANVGFAKANNQALRLTASRYVLLLNSDTAVTANALAKLAAFMDAHPAVGIAGPKLLNPDGTRQYSCDVFPRPPLILLRDKILDRLYPGNTLTRRRRIAQWRYAENFRVDYVIGAVLLIRRATLEQIGLLDEQFFMYAEDMDWCYRAALAGWETYYVGEVSVYHHNRGSSEQSKALASRLRQVRKESLLRFYEKHFGPFSKTLLRIILFFK